MAYNENDEFYPSGSFEVEKIFEQAGLKDFAGNPAGYGALMRRNGESDNLAAHAMMRGWQGPVTSLPTSERFYSGGRRRNLV